MTDREQSVVDAARDYVQKKRTLRNENSLTEGTDPLPPDKADSILDQFFIAESVLFESVDNLDKS